MRYDPYFTKPEAAKECVDFLKKMVPCNTTFLEPCAGNGVFLDYLTNYEAYDIESLDPRVTQMDFFDFKPLHDDYITVSNPPFGKRSEMAIRFFNKAANFSSVIAFILPVSFMKWSVQKQLDQRFKLIAYKYLPPNSFTDNGKDYSIRTVFQIWSKTGVDFRLKEAPPTSHSDFEIWQYNATEGALHMVDEDWEIATYRQGYHDYNRLFGRSDYNNIKAHMTGKRKQQFFFIKPLTDESREIILNMDFNALAERNAITPGFGKGDFVSYYMELKRDLKFV